jgi:hypothetical protein
MQPLSVVRPINRRIWSTDVPNPLKDRAMGPSIPYHHHSRRPLVAQLICCPSLLPGARVRREDVLRRADLRGRLGFVGFVLRYLPL